MRRVRFRPQDLVEPFVIEEVAAPVPGPGQLLVDTEVVGASLGLVRMLRGGAAAAGPGGEVPGPGGEMVGRVVALGAGVEGFRVGDRVGGVVFENVHAQSVLAVPAMVTAVPPQVGSAEALALVRGGLVALSALRAGRFERGESVLVTAAASGAGHLAVQLARALGAGRVVAAVGSAGKADFVRGCGADEVVLYGQDTWGDPVDLVLDGVGGELVQRGVDALAPHGRLVAFSAGGGTVDAGGLLGGLKSVIGFSIGPISRQQPELIERRRAELWDLHAAGHLRPAYEALPLDRIAEAVELIESRRNHGRVLLRTA
ncbi:zinc-binding alcohol dehydrogenase family protein [Kitasatospora sp. NPDC094019]|uniref:quinone oxidoreductase family protein n=1 Tax=Kitasatospora sp. NPDC094019 TaxID=3364091 RepID=UPI003808731E